MLTGARDTGRVVGAASREQARRAARAWLEPVGAYESSGTDVRTEWGVAEPIGGSRPGVANSRRRSQAPFVLTLATALLSGAVLSAAGVVSLYGMASLLIAGASAFLASRLAIRDALPDRRRSSAVVGGVLSLGATVGGWAAGASSPDPVVGLWVYPGILAVAFVVGGLWALARQWNSSREVLQWVLPLLISVALTLMPGLGDVVHWFYLDAFGLEPGDVGVPALWRIAAALTFLPVLPIWFLTAAVWGYAKHLHQVVVHRWMPVTALAVTGILCTALSLLLVPMSSAQAGGRAWQQAVRGDTPGTYRGIKPERVCVQPLKKHIAADGAEFDPSRPYLRIGSAHGTVALWDVRLRVPVKVPSGDVTLVPVAAGTTKCSPPRAPAAADAEK